MVPSSLETCFRATVGDGKQALLLQLFPQGLGAGCVISSKEADAPVEPGKNLLSPEGRLSHSLHVSASAPPASMDFMSIIATSLCPLHAADVKSVGSVAVGPQGHLPLRLPHRRRQGKRPPGGSHWCSARNASVTCSFSSGRTVQVEYTSTPPGCHIPCGVVQHAPSESPAGQTVRPPSYSGCPAFSG